MVVLVVVLKYGGSKTLYLSYYIPSFVLLHVVVDIIHYPAHNIVVALEVVNHPIYSQFFNLTVVEFNAEICREV